jgi:hypothetical protein
MLTRILRMGYYNTQDARPMAGRTHIPSATPMAARERNEPQAEAVLLRALAYLQGI